MGRKYRGAVANKRSPRADGRHPRCDRRHCALDEVAAFSPSLYQVLFDLSAHGFSENRANPSKGGDAKFPV
jgi:hypothetical protein